MHPPSNLNLSIAPCKSRSGPFVIARAQQAPRGTP